jgi:peptide/nickel transport system ATP-binding protein
MSEPLLEIDNLEIAYQTDIETVRAVNGISFKLEKGRTIGIVGETGAGKTTAALAILRLLPERTARYLGGSVKFNGTDILKIPENSMCDIRGEKISMIFQDPMTALNPILTVGDQIAEAILLHNHDNKPAAEIERQVDRTLEMVGIQARRKKEYPHQFSGGMKQRVVIAMALACEPELLIADEPTTALDVTIQAQVLAMMKELKLKFGTSMIMITHDLGIVAQTCDSVAVMYAGKIVENGSLRDIFTGDRHHPYTVGLFGSIPSLESGTGRLTPIEGMMPDPTNLPPGCAFAPRCPRRTGGCEDKAAPVYRRDTHSIACCLFGGEASL